MPKEPEFDTVNKLYLELSQVATATTGRELRLIHKAQFMRDEIVLFINKTEKEDGTIVVPTKTDIARLRAAVTQYDR